MKGTLVTNQAAITDACSSEPGAMGLRGLLAAVGQSTWMVIGAVILFLALWQMQRMHAEEIGTLRQLHIEERDFNRSTLAGLTRVIEQNTGAIDGLANEIHKLRSPVEK